MTKRILKPYTAREILRQAAISESEKLMRSVTRLTAYDHLPCVEYQDEVKRQYEITNKLLYIQNCRSALESTIAGKNVRLRFKINKDIITTSFYKTQSGDIKIINLKI